MDVAALILWILTAAGGFVLLGTWLTRGGLRGEGAPSRFPPALILGHFLLAAAGLVLWIVYLAAGGSALAWAAFVLLLAAALGGFVMFARWLAGRSEAATADRRPPEQHFPVAVVGLHGVLAAVTLVLVLLSALQAGG